MSAPITAPALRPLATGEILDAGFSLFRRHFVQLAVISLVAQGLPTILSVYAQSAGGVTEAATASLAAVVLSLIGTAVGTGASTRVVADSYLGRPTRAADALQWVLPYVGRIILLTFMVSLLFGLGLLLFVVPGIIVFCGYSVAAPALVVERLGAQEAMRRSWDLTKGFRGKVFLVFLVGGIVVYAVTIAAAFAAGLFAAAIGSQAVGVVAAVLTGVLSIIVYPFLYSALTVLYYDLRVRKEGLDLELLESQLVAG